MATFLQKSMQWLGLVDDEYDDLASYDQLAQNTPAIRTPAVNQSTVTRTSMGAPDIDLTSSPMGVRTFMRDEPAQGITMTAPRSTGGSSVVRPIPSTPTLTQSSRVHVVEPDDFRNAQEIGDRLRANEAVVVTVQAVDTELARRLIDFCSGATYVLGGRMEKVARNVFLLTPANVEISNEEKARLAEKGLYRS